VNDELKRMWKEALVTYTKALLGNCLEGLRKVTEDLSQDCRSPGRDLNPGPAEY
jgi:hypothetical protein